MEEEVVVGSLINSVIFFDLILKIFNIVVLFGTNIDNISNNNLVIDNATFLSVKMIISEKRK